MKQYVIYEIYTWKKWEEILIEVVRMHTTHKHQLYRVS